MIYSTVNEEAFKSKVFVLGFVQKTQKSLEIIFTEFKLSTTLCFQDMAVSSFSLKK